MLSNNSNDEFLPSPSSGVVESPRKRLRLDNTARKSWSLMDGRTDNEVLQEMGVSLLEPDESDPAFDSVGLNKSTLKRKRDIENVNPNVNGSPRTRYSPRMRTSPGPSRTRSPRSTEKGKPLQQLEANQWLLDEETPPTQPLASLPGPGFSAGATTPQPVTPLGAQPQPSPTRGAACGSATEEDTFTALSDEMMLSVFRWLPKRTLAHCMLVCKRWYRVACDETLWQRLDLGNKSLAADALGRVLARKPLVLRLASSEIGNWTPTDAVPPSRVQYLDLSMASVSASTLAALLARCPALRKLSLENVAVDDQCCRLIGKCTQLETLNLAMARGLTTEGLTAILEGCPGLSSLNVSWCQLSERHLLVLAESLPEHLQRLNISGAKPLTDDLLSKLSARCPRLRELDASDCGRLLDAARALRPLTRLEHLALSRCYLVPPRALAQLGALSSLQFLELWGTLQSTAVSALRGALPAVQLNQFMFSAIARPTVGTRRTSIWGLRTRD